MFHREEIHVPSLILMIIGTLFALTVPIITLACSTPSLVMSITKKETHHTKYAIVTNTVALAAAVLYILFLVIPWEI